MTPAAAKWAEMLKARGISLETAERNGLAVQHVYSPASGGYVDALCFPYMRDGELINIKYRGPDKTFWQVKGAEKILYGLDDVVGEEEVILVEGEMDKLALEEAGFKNVVSVPDGAPGKVRDGPTPAPEEDKKYEYLWNCRAQLDSISRFVIAADSDGPGQALSEELARRLGKERCWKVSWPEGCKDANEALQKEGVDTVRECLTTAEGFPLRGLFRFSEFAPEIEAYFNMSTANELRGVSTGWRNIDNHYRIVPGELTVVTGVPNSGKSEWVDALMCNLAVQHGWSFALCSLENKVHEHARKLVEKYVGEPWFEGKYSKAPRMNPDTMRTGMKWLNDHFVLVRHEDDELSQRGLDFRISARSRLAPRHSRFTDRSVQRARSQAPDRTDGDGIRLSNAHANQTFRPALRRPRLVRRPPSTIAQLEGRVSRSVRHLRFRSLHQQVRQRHRRPPQPRRKARFTSRGYHQRAKGEKQSRRLHRRPEARVPSL